MTRSHGPRVCRKMARPVRHFGTVLFVGVIALCVLSAAVGQTLSGVLSKRDQARMKQLFRGTAVERDLATAYHVVAGITALGKDGEDTAVLAKTCKAAQSLVQADDLESLYLASFIADTLGTSCKLSVPAGAESFLTNSIVEGATAQDLFYAVSALVNLKKKVDDKKAVPLLKAVMDTDESPMSSGLVFQAVARLKTKEDLSGFFDAIEDVVAWADRTESTLYYEDGLPTTSTVTTGIFQLMEAMNKAASIKSSDVTKLGNYFLNSKYASSVDDAALVAMATAHLAKNKFFVPAALTVEDHRAVTAERPNFEVHVSTILDSPLGKATVKAESVTDSEEERVAADKSFSTKDNLVYSLPLYTVVGQKAGVYTLSLSATFAKGSTSADLSGIEVQVVVAQKVTISSAELEIADREQESSGKGKQLSYPATSQDKFAADYHQKVVLRYSLTSVTTRTPVTVHQAFVRLVRSGSQQEVFFITEQDKQGGYTFEMDVNKAGKDSFNSESGDYVMSLLIGDSAVEQPLEWEICTIKLTFADQPSTQKDHLDAYKAKPEIAHVFREPEKRPPAVVSTVFTGLVLAPLGLLLVVWLGMGANLSNVTSNGPWALVFQLGLVAIFGLYYCFWSQLNMFQTLKYLALLGVPTFIAGNRLLRRIAQARKA